MTDSEVLALISEQLRIPKEQLTSAVSLMQSSQAEAQELRKKLQDFATKNADITFSTPSGSVTFPSLKKMDAATKAQQNAVNSFFTATAEYNYVDSAGVTRKVKPLALMANAIGYPWAMSKVQFEANRQQNLEKYEASGFVHMGKHYNNYAVETVGDGLYIYTAEQHLRQQFFLGSDSATQSHNAGPSKSNTPVLNISGVLTEIKFLNTKNDILNCQVEMPPAEDGTRTYDSATGISVRHATPALAFAAETETNKVVIERVDVWGFEGFLREINDADPFVYLHGLIQSRAPKINGVVTTDDNVRPSTYFAWYEGHNPSIGKGVNWQTATEAQRIAIASDPKNNIRFNDATGNFEQWCVRGRSFAGLGNGDFSFVDPVQNSPMSFDYLNKSRIPVQGFNDTLGIVESGSNFFASTLFEAYNRNPHKGIFTAWSGSGYAINNECYFLVCGTVNRLNQGCYHPSFNRYGAAAFAWLNNPTTGQVSWSDTGNGLARKPTNSRMCFVSFDDGGSKTDLTGSGSIGVGYSGRPDGRYYDAIYASGQGGVCRDMRYKADGLSLAELAEHDLKIKSGEYRGVEKLQLIKIYPHNGNTGVTSASFSGHQYTAFWTSQLAVKSTEHYFVVNVDTSEIFDSRSINIQLTVSATKNLYWPSSWGSLPNMRVIRTHETDLSVAGEYLHADVFGPPDNILLSNDFKDGWVGSWVPQIPDGSPDTIKWTKPISALSSAQALVSDDNGASWVIGTQSSWFSSEVTNSSESLTIPIGRIVVATYKTKAKLTKPANVAAIHRSHAGIGNIFLTQNYLERDLCYSLTDNIIIRSSHALSESTVPLNDYGRLYEGKFYNASPRTFDMPSAFPLPDNNSPALMALNYAVEQNGMAFINYAYAELKFDSAAGDWGCDGNVPMINGQSTMIDDNGNIVKVGTAQTGPLGWVKK